MGKACIEVVLHGATLYQDYEDWATGTIQDGEVAYEIAQNMLEGELYQDNLDEPEYYATYRAIDVSEFRKQVQAVKEE